MEKPLRHYNTDEPQKHDADREEPDIKDEGGMSLCV
jgi:hypothetical protein